MKSLTGQGGKVAPPLRDGSLARLVKSAVGLRLITGLAGYHLLMCAGSTLRSIPGQGWHLQVLNLLHLPR